MDHPVQTWMRWGVLLAGVLLVAGCGARQNTDSDELTGSAPAELEVDQKRKLRACVFAAAERSYAKQHTGNLTGTLASVRGALENPETSDGKFRARRHDWTLDWDSENIERLRVRFGTRGLEFVGEANRPPDVMELHRRLETDRELPDLHVRTLEGNEVEGFQFHFVEKTLPELTDETENLDQVYARAREMGVEPVMRDVCPGRRKGSDDLRDLPGSGWTRTVSDIPGGWRLSGYETSVQRKTADSDGAIYELSQQKSKWDAVELELRDDTLVFRVADLIPDPDYTYPTPTPLPQGLKRLAESRGVETWARFETCPRSMCGLDPSELQSAGATELKYVAKLVRRIDHQRAQLYDLQAASWLAQPARNGVRCSRKLLEAGDSVSRLSLGLEGELRFALAETADADHARKTLEDCSSSVVQTQRADEGWTELQAHLGNSDELHPAILDFEPKWAQRDFVDGAEQLRYIVRNRTAPQIGSALEKVRARLGTVDRQLMTRPDFLDTVATTLLAPPYRHVQVTPLPAAQFSAGVEYHRVVLRADATRQAAAQFFTLLDGLQEDSLVLVERAEWRTGSDRSEMVTTLGVLSRN